MIESLIDKQDTFEIVRDQITTILVSEVKSQMTLASQADKNPDDFKLRIFSERSNPWDLFLNAPVEDKSPLINVWYETSTFDESASNVVARQKASAIFNIDCYGYDVSKDDPTGGHKPGDEEAALSVHKAIRLVRNILMASTYTYLALPKTVWRRFVQNITVFQPELDAQNVQKIIAARLAFRVEFSEFSPQVSGNIINELSVTTFRAEDGEILTEQEFIFT